MRRVLLMVLCLISLLAIPANAIDHIVRMRVTKVSGNGEVIVTSGHQVPWLKREDVANNTIAFVSQPHGVYSATQIAINHDGSMIATSFPEEIKIWDSQLRLKHRLPIRSHGLTFSPNGRWLASKDFKGSINDGFLQLIDTQSLKVVRTISGGIGTLIGMTFTRDGKQILTGGHGGKTLIVIDVATGERRKVPLDFYVQSFAVDAKDQTIYVGGTIVDDDSGLQRSGRLAVVDRKSSQVLKRCNWTSPITSVAVLPKLGLLIGDKAGEVNVFNSATGDATETLLLPSSRQPVSGIYRSADNFLIVQRYEGEVGEIYLGHDPD